MFFLSSFPFLPIFSVSYFIYCHEIIVVSILRQFEIYLFVYFERHLNLKAKNIFNFPDFLEILCMTLWLTTGTIFWELGRNADYQMRDLRKDLSLERYTLFPNK